MRISLELPDRIDEAKAREFIAQVEQALRDWPDGRLAVCVVSIDLAHTTQNLLVGHSGFGGAHWLTVAETALKKAADAAAAHPDNPGAVSTGVRIETALACLGLSDPDSCEEVE